MCRKPTQNDLESKAESYKDALERITELDLTDDTWLGVAIAIAEKALKEELKLEKNDMIKENDIVTISDFSYSAYATKDGLNKNGSFHPNARQQFKVLRIGKEDVQVFTYNLMSDCRRIADTILIGLKDGVVWFAWSGGLTPVTHTITIDGKDVEISHESFENLKRQLER